MGCSGSGKTTVARELTSRFNLKLHELDFIAWGQEDGGALLPYETRLNIAEDLSSGDGWIAEGTYLGWTAVFMERADLIVWMDVPMRVALWRVFWRHVRAELRRDNRFPGWSRLFRFMKMVSDQYRNRSSIYEPPDIQIGPESIDRELEKHRSKVIKGRDSRVIGEIETALAGRLSRPAS